MAHPMDTLVRGTGPAIPMPRDCDSETTPPPLGRPGGPRAGGGRCGDLGFPAGAVRHPELKLKIPAY